MLEKFAPKALCYRYSGRFLKAKSSLQSFFKPKAFNQWQKAIELLFNFDFSIFHSHASESKHKFYLFTVVPDDDGTFFCSICWILSACSQFMTFNPIGRLLKLALAITSIFLRKKTKDERRKETKTGFRCLLQFQTSLMCSHHLCTLANV